VPHTNFSTHLRPADREPLRPASRAQTSDLRRHQSTNYNVLHANLGNNLLSAAGMPPSVVSFPYPSQVAAAINIL
jgi:hypothetical protein